MNVINILATKSDIGLGNVDNTSDLNKPISNATQTALNNKEDKSNKSTVVTLGTSDTLYPTQNAVKTYVDTAISASSSLQLGETSTTAYRGDRGKTAYDHSQTIGNPHGTSKADVGLSNVANLDTSTTLNITDSTNKRFVTDSQKTTLQNTSGINTGDETNATIKTKLGPANATNDGYLSQTDYNTFNNKQNALGFTPENIANKENLTLDNSATKYPTNNLVKNTLNNYLLSSLKGANNGLAELDSNGKVLSAQLPSYVDDVLEFSTISAFPITGESAKIYIAIDTNKSYRWGGSSYVEISSSLSLGETSSTAYRGDRGKIAYDHSQLLSGNPHNVTKADVGLSNVDNTSDINKPISTAVQTALNSKLNIPSGTTAQYLDGTGNLQTFPTLTDAGSLITEVYNSTGATLTKGTIVRIDGGQGNLPTITKAQADNDTNSAQTFGIVRNDITNNNNGFVIIAGKLIDYNTNGLGLGTQLYLSGTTAGTFTTIKPQAPIHLVYVGIVVRDHPTQGVIEVKIQNGYELDEIHDVKITSIQNNQLLFWNNTTNLWENKTISKTDVGLSNVDNTSDLNKPISTATQTALNGKQNTLGYTAENIANKDTSNGYVGKSGGAIVFPDLSNSFTALIKNVNTDNREYYFPDKNGTVAMTSDLSSKQNTLTLTTTGTSGPATLINDVLNIPQYSGGGGTQTLAQTLTNGNSAGSNSIDMNNQDILNIDDLSANNSATVKMINILNSTNTILMYNC